MNDNNLWFARTAPERHKTFFLEGWRPQYLLLEPWMCSLCVVSLKFPLRRWRRSNSLAGKASPMSDWQWHLQRLWHQQLMVNVQIFASLTSGMNNHHEDFYRMIVDIGVSQASACLEQLQRASLHSASAPPQTIVQTVAAFLSSRDLICP